MTTENKLYDEIDNLLVAISLGTGNPGLKRGNVWLSHFDKAEIQTMDSAHSAWHQAVKGAKKIFGSIHPLDLNNHWDVSMLTRLSDPPVSSPQAPAGAPGNVEDGFILSRFRSVPLKRALGVGILRSRFLGEYSAMLMDHGRESYNTVCVLLHCVGRDDQGDPIWEYLDKQIETSREGDPKQLSTKMSAYLEVQFTRAYLWRVCFSYRGYPSLAFTTDPTGIRALLKMREFPDELGRRALLHAWVSEHWRSAARPAEEDSTWVRNNVAEPMKFYWMGLVCEVVPSQVAATDTNFDSAARRHARPRDRR